jgi:hypothetical protein
MKWVNMNFDVRWMTDLAARNCAGLAAPEGWRLASGVLPAWFWSGNDERLDRDERTSDTGATPSELSMSSTSRRWSLPTAPWTRIAASSDWKKSIKSINIIAVYHIQEN